jgi:hypothetical protein
MAANRKSLVSGWCHDETVIVTVNVAPAFALAPLTERATI